MVTMTERTCDFATHFLKEHNEVATGWAENGAK